MFRQAAAALAITSLAFAGLAAEDGEAWASVDDISIDVVDGSIIVTGTPTFGGGAPVTIVDGDGGDFAPGLDIISATIFQEGEDILGTMEITGSIMPGALYSIPLGLSGTGDNRLFAFGNTGADPSFAVANLDDGISVSAITGTAALGSGSITWTAPLATLTASPGATITAGGFDVEASFGIQAGGSTLNGTALSPISGGFDTASWIAPKLTIGGGMKVEVVGGDVEEFANGKLRRGVATATIDELPPGTYTVTVRSGFLEASFEQVFTVTV